MRWIEIIELIDVPVAIFIGWLLYRRWIRRMERLLREQRQEHKQYISALEGLIEQLRGRKD